MATAWQVKAPDYVAPTSVTPAWVWSIAGWGPNVQDGVDVVVLRLDYVKRTENLMFERVNNFRPGWQSGACTMYMPIMMYLNEGILGSAGGSFAGGYDYFMNPANFSPSAITAVNTLWKNYIYKFLYGLTVCSGNAVYLALPNPAP